MKYALVLALAPLFAAPADPPCPRCIPSFRALEFRCLKAETYRDMSILLAERFLIPYDEWLRLNGPEGEPLSKKNPEIFYLLRIETPGPDREGDIWIRFSLKWADVEKYAGEGAECEWDYHESLTAYAKRKRAGLERVLHRTFIEGLSDPDVRDAAIYGTAHLYRLATDAANPSAPKPGDLIY